MSIRSYILNLQNEASPDGDEPKRRLYAHFRREPEERKDVAINVVLSITNENGDWRRRRRRRTHQRWGEIFSELNFSRLVDERESSFLYMRKSIIP